MFFFNFTLRFHSSFFIAVIVTFFTRNSFCVGEQLSCNIFNSTWKYLDASFEGCNIENQTIKKEESRIISPFNVTLKAFSIKNNYDVKFIPVNIGEKFPNILVFQIFNCSVKKIGKTHFNNLFQLRQIVLTNNVIAEVDDQPFQNQRQLEWLSLSNNKITWLYGKVFSKLRKLKQLNLEDNQIVEIHSQLFKSLSDLRVLNLENSKIRDLYDNVFDGLINVKFIYLTGNKIQRIERDLFQYNIQLERLWLDSNNIREIWPTVFDRLNNLTYIDLSHNTCINAHFATNLTLSKLSFQFEQRKHLIESLCPWSRFLEQQPPISAPPTIK